jgi:uncharacterized protein (TIGR02996 family)
MANEHGELGGLEEWLVISLEEERLLRAVRDDPASDEPRLAYADWLAKNGYVDRAEFICIQIEMARCDDPERLVLLEQMAWDRHKTVLDYLGLIPDVLMDLPAIPKIHCFFRDGTKLRKPPTGVGGVDVEDSCQVACVFSRGFLDELAVDAHGFLAILPVFYGRSALDSIRISVHHDHMSQGEDWLNYREESSIPIEHEILVVLAHLLGTFRLERLSLCDVRCRDLGLWRGVFNSPGAATLQELRLGFAWIGEELLAEIANSPNLRRLRRLSVGSFGLCDNGLKALAASPYLNNLRELTIATDDHYAPDDPSKNCGAGWRQLKARSEDIPGFRLNLHIHLEADEEMYNVEDTFVYYDESGYEEVEGSSDWND